MTVKTRSHYKLSAIELAKWLDEQGDDCWWSVDGDPLLTGRIPFPCPSSVLSKDLRRINRDLLLLDSNDDPNAAGQQISSNELSKLAYIDTGNNRVFLFAWANATKGRVEWLLVEDRETAESYRAENPTA